MNAPTDRGQYLIREEVGGEATLAPISNGARWPVRPGAVYDILAKTTFENISITHATKNGRDLVIYLATGDQVVFTDYFDINDPSDDKAQAEFDQSLPLRLSSLDYDIPTDPILPQAEYLPQASNVPVTLPQQGDYRHPEYPSLPPYPYQDDEGWNGGGVLGLAGIALGGLALAAVSLRSSEGVSQIVNSADRNENAEGSPALDLAVQSLVERSASLTLPDDQALYDSIQLDIKELLAPKIGSPSETGSGSSLDLAVQSLLERSASLTLPDDQALYDSIWLDIKDLLQTSESPSDADSGIVINNNNYGTSSGGSNTYQDTVSSSVQAVTIVRSDNYFTEGEIIPVGVKFSDTVTAGDPENLTFEFNDGDYSAQYSSGNGSDTLTFELVLSTIEQLTELTASNSALILGGSSLIDSNNRNVDVTTLPAWQGEVYVEPVPEIVEITAIPDLGEFTNDLMVGEEIAFYVKYDMPVEYADDKLTLALNSGSSAEFVSQTGPDGEENTAYLKFVYTLQDGGEANDSSKELLPSALAENGGANVKTPNGSDARTQISEAVVAQFKTDHDIIYDLSQPAIVSFDLDIQVDPNRSAVERDFGGTKGTKTLLPVSGVVTIIYDEEVVTEPAMDALPELAIVGLLTDEFNSQGNFEPQTGRAAYSEALTRPDVNTPTLNSEQIYEFSNLYIELEDPDATSEADPNPNEVLLSAAEGLILNMANVVGQGGVPASSNLPDNPANAVIGRVLPTRNNGGWAIDAGAGPFLADSIAFEIDQYFFETVEPLADTLQNTQRFYMVYAHDSNDGEDNYRDEFTGNLTDLSIGGNGVLRALVSENSEIQHAFVTPISELMVQVVETLDTPAPQDIHNVKTAISSFFQMGDFIYTEASFINEIDLDGELIAPVDLSVAVALASLSAMDSVSGSLWHTLEILKPVFLADASREELAAAYKLVEGTRQILTTSASLEFEAYANDVDSLLDGMTDHLVQLVTRADDSLTLVHEATEYALDDIELTSLVEHESAKIFLGSEDQQAVDFGGGVEIFNLGDVQYGEWDIG